MLKIKLQPRGKKHQKTYRIIVAEAKSKLNGKYTDDLGHYNPFTNEFVIDKEKMQKWIKQGAKLTLGVNRLLEPDKFPRKKKDRTKVKKEESKSTEAETKKTPETEVKSKTKAKEDTNKA